MISVQPLLKQHLDSLLELEMLCFSTPWSRAQFLSELQNPNAVYLAATDGRTVVGYGGLWRVLDEGQITEHRRTSRMAAAGHRRPSAV